MYDKLAQRLFGAKRAESDSVLTDATTNTIHGTATSASADGSVMVELSSDVTNPEPVEIDGETYYSDADTSVELPTTTSVQEGDEVLVSVYGGTPLRSPVVTGVVGSGDRVAGVAAEALDVANATGQHFWSDTDGAHVTEVTQEEWTDPTDPGYQSGPNSLWNSLGMLFRDGLNNLLALVAGTASTQTETVDSSLTSYALDDQNATITSVTIAGTALTSADWWLDYYGELVLDGDIAAEYDGQSMVIAYRPSASLSFFDGLGNAASNIAASITKRGASFAQGFNFGEWAEGAVNFFGGNLAINASYQPSRYNGDLEYIDQTVDIVSALDGDGDIIDGQSISHITMSSRLWADETDGNSANVRINPMASGGGHGGAALVVSSTPAYSPTSNIGMYSDTLTFSTESLPLQNQTFTMEQAICALQQPGGTWTGSNSTATDGNNTWRICSFPTLIAGAGAWSDYFTIDGGTITALRDVVLEISGNAYWNSGAVAQYGFGLFTGGTFDSGGYMTNGTGEVSNFAYKAAAAGQFSVPFPPRLVYMAAGSHLYVCRYTRSGAVYRNGSNMSYITIKVIEDRSS